MKRIKRIVALALATVMMMAMSTVAFAAESIDGPTIKVTNISARDEKTQLSVYTLATVDKETNTINVVDWAKSAYNSELEIEFDATELNNAFKNAGNVSAVATATSLNGADVEFSGLAAGVYMIKAIGDKVVYNTMVAVTYDTDEYGNYIAKTEAQLKAKGTSNTVEKEADDQLVSAGQVVNFTITSTVPYNKAEYKIYDKVTNLSAPEITEIKVGGETVDGRFVLDTEKADLYVLDLTSLVKGTNDNAGKSVVVTYSAKVLGTEGYVNGAYDSTNGSYDKPVTEVTGYTGDITLTKKAADTDEVLLGAEFTVSKNGGDALYFVKVEDGVYDLADSSVENATTTVVATNGTVQVRGLDEGTYHFTETKAPEGYSINTAGKDFTIEQGETVDGPISLSEELLDSKLSTLPYTGGMGTTIFTVLGVAIMAIAAALYFATKKNSKAAQ